MLSMNTEIIQIEIIKKDNKKNGNTKGTAVSEGLDT